MHVHIFSERAALLAFLTYLEDFSKFECCSGDSVLQKHCKAMTRLILLLVPGCFPQTVEVADDFVKRLAFRRTAWSLEMER